VDEPGPRPDGRGYPDRLPGRSIPLGAAIVGLADAWDAMTTDRPYHRALDPAEAQAELREHRGTQFAPAVVDAFFRILERSGETERKPVRTPDRLRVAARTGSQPA
jgi:HD-GYP domain-containing protein (c-di-GMP phosphodiesterase class II)